ncbi:MAG: sigma-54-dependent Fis family transcriptional regulator [Planctomycetales bacterium]|nr:sigma-54-dependent Fis family transcriptional regulator [Planctomycetales bacterium]
MHNESLLASPVVESPAMKKVVDVATRFARSSASVLITGESGTGKEVIARTIHEHSKRCDGPYVRVNCAALSESLFESELFGHEEGAFTGATHQRSGRFELASGGTLLLDEISEIPLRLQAKLLRVLEEGEFQRVGGNESQLTNIRVLSTSNRDLRRDIAKGRFREDLYFRLGVLEIGIAPLRERRADIEPLVRHFVDRFADENPEGHIDDIAPSVLERLENYDWPGNVRQLRNVVHQMCVLATTSCIGLQDIPDLAVPTNHATSDLYDLTLRDAEQLIIEGCLKRYHGNKTAAARHLGISVRTLHNKVRTYLDAA